MSNVSRLGVLALASGCAPDPVLLDYVGWSDSGLQPTPGGVDVLRPALQPDETRFYLEFSELMFDDSVLEHVTATDADGVSLELVIRAAVDGPEGYEVRIVAPPLGTEDNLLTVGADVQSLQRRPIVAPYRLRFAVFDEPADDR